MKASQYLTNKVVAYLLAKLKEKDINRSAKSIAKFLDEISGKRLGEKRSEIQQLNLILKLRMWQHALERELSKDMSPKQKKLLDDKMLEMIKKEVEK